MTEFSFANGTCPVCGREHRCPIRHVVVARGALSSLPSITEGYSRLLLVADENTLRAAGEAAATLLGEKMAGRVVFPGDRLLIPNEDAIAAVQASLDGIDMILGVGSGVIQDLCKYVSKVAGIPYVIVATAPSMDGYASDGAAMILGGMKVTVPSGLPYAIVADTEVLASAPAEMIRAGYGDIVGKYSALSDWRLSALVKGEYFCAAVHDATMAEVKKTIAAADDIIAGTPEGMEILAGALVNVGILMSYAFSSRPASGSEHHLSHFFEITGLVEGRDYLPHGIDVACSTVLTLALRERLLAATWERRPVESADERNAEIRRIYGPVAEGCIALQEKVGNYKTDRVPVYLEKEAEIRALLADVPASEEIRALLAAAGIEMAPFYALYGEAKIAAALRYAKELKDRYTVLWMAYDLGL